MPTSTPLPPAGSPAPETVTVCAAGCNFTTIQAAVDDASATGHIIKLLDAVHTESGIIVDKEVTIQGQGADRTVVQAHENAGQATDRVFFITEGATVTIENLTIRHGSPTEGRRSGGGILNRGTLTLSRCVVRDNLANCGGGILNDGGTLTMTDCIVRDNTADAQAPQGYDCGSGGAIKNVEGGTLTLTNCTLSGNHAEGKGGGLHVSCKSKATLVNCTLSGNHAVGRGGGIHFKGELTLIHCTISNNSARGLVRGSGIDVKAGGGISARGPLHYVNTLIAHNPQGGDCVLSDQGTIVTTANNLVEDGSCSPAYSGDPNVGLLTDDGGLLIHPLLPGSQAIDAIPAGDCPLLTDQRGQLRPAVQTSAGTPCDIGAFELQVPPAATPIPAVATPAGTPLPPAPPSEMVHVPAGEFTMGSDEGENDERPAHTVYLDAFYMDKTEVTNAQFAQFLNERGNQKESGATWLNIGDEDCLIVESGGQYQPKSGYAHHPVIEVNWYGAAAYCEWAGKQLPTEAEWEKAARGEEARTYPWGEEIDCNHANYGNCVGETTAVGSYSPGASPYGALDMAGNVWEWVADWHYAYYYGASPDSNPRGPDSGSFRCLRGGSWHNGEKRVRTTTRFGYAPADSLSSIGFRCARSGSGP